MGWCAGRVPHARVAVITGTSRGLGRAMAQTLATRGWTVVATMRAVEGRNAPASAALRAWADRVGVTLRVVEIDITDDTSVEQGVQEALALTGRIDALINNAGVGALGVTETFTPAQWQQVFAVNIGGAVRMNRAVVPHMRRQGSGVLVHVTSDLGRVVLPCLAIYCASKFALEALAEAYHYEVAEFGIDSVIIEPGPHPTQFLPSEAEPAEAMIPAEAARGEDYGAMQAVIAQLGAVATLPLQQGMLHPQAVADAVADLLAQPHGTRPLRATVNAGWVDPLNSAAAALQQETFARLGLTKLLMPPYRGQGG